MALSKLGERGYGKSLLSSLQERAAPGKTAVAASVPDAAIEMRHLPKQGQWQVLETANFRILHNQSRELAEKVARIAEQTRLTTSRKWFGDSGEVWNPRLRSVPPRNRPRL